MFERLLLSVFLLAGLLPAQQTSSAGGLMPALERAGDQRAAWEQAVDAVPAAQRDAFAFLLSGMPTRDLQRLDPADLVADCALAHAARAAAPWGEQIPDAVFHDAVLPYAHVTETREMWRAAMRERCLPMIEGCATPGEAAQRLNEQLFGAVGVRYSTQRRRADQSCGESIEQGLASCTGLSILLASACRSVGVPARLAGIAEWPNKPGNHTWVEVWDLDGWHFVGAAEPSKQGLDHTWFQKDAALASSDDPRHAIWAVCWDRSQPRFPLVWSRGAEVHAVDVTPRYAAKQLQVAADQTRLRIDVRVGDPARRIAAEVQASVQDGGDQVWQGTAKDEGADTNDHLEFEVPRGSSIALRVRWRAQTIELVHVTKGEPEELVTVNFGASPAAAETALAEAAARYFAADADARAGIEFPAAADRLVATDDAEARRIVWQAWRDAKIHTALREDFEADRVRTADRESPYTVKTVGEPDADGYGLVIAMHGGGGAPQRVNDSQWRHMQIYYKDHPEAGGYRYVALRAPNNTWNGFYDDAICPLVARLIQQFVLFGDVNPDRVLAIGYSHGGYGAFSIGPKMPDRFAAVHASASAPTPGESPAWNLRNLRFSFMVGTEDTAYGRHQRCVGFDKEVAALRQEDPDGYPVRYLEIQGNGHGGLPDRDLLEELVPLRRAPTPDRVRWQPSDDRLDTLYWLHCANPGDGQRFDVEIDGQRIVIHEAAGTAPKLQAWLDARLLDVGKPVTIVRGETATKVDLTPSARTLCATMLHRGDIQLAATCAVDLPGAAED